MESSDRNISFYENTDDDKPYKKLQDYHDENSEPNAISAYNENDGFEDYYRDNGVMMLMHRFKHDGNRR